MYRFAIGVALAAAFVLIWVNGAELAEGYPDAYRVLRRTVATICLAVSEGGAAAKYRRCKTEGLMRPSPVSAFSQSWSVTYFETEPAAADAAVTALVGYVASTREVDGNLGERCGTRGTRDV